MLKIKGIDCCPIHYQQIMFLMVIKNHPTQKTIIQTRLMFTYSKLKGEKAISEIDGKYYIIRLSWVIGENGSNFVTKF